MNAGPRISYFEMPAFHDAFVHGLSMVLGGIFGLCVWVSFQPLPVIKPYLFEIALKVPVPVTPAAVEKAPVSPEQADAMLGSTPTTPDEIPVSGTLPVTTAPLAPVMSEQHDLKQQVEPHVVGGPGAPIAQESLSPIADEPVASGPVVETRPTGSLPAEVPVPVDTVVPMIAFPASGMVEDKPPYGQLPIIRAADKMRPFDVYRQPFSTEQLKKPLVALVVLDMGLSEKSSNEFLKSMPKGTSMVISRTARGPQEFVDRARAAGFEVWADLAVEPPQYPANDPGAYALFSNASIDQNLDALYRQLSSFGGYAGVFASSSSPYFLNNQDAEFLSHALFERGLSLAINAPRVDETFLKNAADQKSPFYQGAMLRLEEPVLSERFIKVAETQAHTQGYSILVITPNSAIRKAIVAWANGLSEKGIVIAPLSVITERGINLMAGR